MAVWQCDSKAGSGKRVLASGSLCTCGRCDCECLRGSEFLSPLSREDPTPIPENLLNEVTDPESPPSQMGGEGRGRAELAPDKRRGEERRGREGKGGEGARAGEGGR